MSDQRYSLNEIDRMRSAVNFIVWHKHAGVWIDPEDFDQKVENYLRSYLAGGVRVEEVEAQASKLMRVAAPPPPEVSAAALNLIITQEDGSPAYYAKFEQHFSWPGGMSGPTLGVGYDCGYVSEAQARIDWASYVDAPTLDAIVDAAGRTGQAAQAWVASNANRVTIPWDTALAQFKAVEIPQWLTICSDALPNWVLLPLDCQGALLSLTYNRGASYDAPGSRYVEMRNIKTDMISKNFSDIPHQILAMQRLWPPPSSDLWNRRAAESELFRQGLAAS